MSKPSSPALQAGHPLASGLVRCFAFAEGSGSNVNDHASGGHGLTTRTGGATAAGEWGTDGTQGEFLSFDGATRDATGPDTGLPDGSSPRTLAILFRSSSGAGGYMMGYGTSGDGLLAMGLADANPQTPAKDVRITTAARGAGGFTDRADGSWHLAHVVIDPDAKARIFVDGTAVAISSTGLDAPGSATPVLIEGLATVVGTNPFYLGQAGGSGAPLLLQSFDVGGVWAWSRALSDAEVAGHAADPWAMLSPPVTPMVPTLDVSPENATATSGGSAVSISATLTNSSASLAASVSGGGTLSTTAPTPGVAFAWTPPPTGSGAATVTVADAADGLSDTCVIAFAEAQAPPGGSDGLPYRRVFDLQSSGLITARVRARRDDGQDYPGLGWSTDPIVELGAGQYRVSLALPLEGLDIEVDDGLGGLPRFDAWNPPLDAPGGSGGLSAAGVRAAIGMAAANLDAQLAAKPDRSEFLTGDEAQALIADTTVTLPDPASSGYATAAGVAGLGAGIGVLGTSVGGIAGVLGSPPTGTIADAVSQVKADTGAIATAVSQVKADTGSTVVAVSQVKGDTGKVAGLIETNAGTDQFKESALAQAPAGNGSGGGGSGLTFDQVKGACVAAIDDNKGGYRLAADGLDAIMIEPTSGLNARQALVLIAAGAAGDVSGGGSDQIIVSGAGTMFQRMTAIVDEDGNRTVTLVLPR